MIALGVDGISANRPDVLLAHLRRGLAPAAVAPVEAPGDLTDDTPVGDEVATSPE